MSRIAAVLIILGLTGCGMKGPLVMPTGPAPEPLLGNPKPAPAKDVSTPKSSQPSANPAQ